MADPFIADEPSASPAPSTDPLVLGSRVKGLLGKALTQEQRLENSFQMNGFTNPSLRAATKQAWREYDEALEELIALACDGRREARSTLNSEAGPNPPPYPTTQDQSLDQ
ncbi:MAG: hypothetical protein Q7T61_01125 [Caulobacter sp.]|nr:hypothetical protein [Caulobacter sp.]